MSLEFPFVFCCSLGHAAWFVDPCADAALVGSPFFSSFCRGFEMF